MCEYCGGIKLVESFDTPKDYERTIEYIRELISEYGFVFEDGNCEIGKHRNAEGGWIDDIIYHKIKCPRCGQIYSCTVNTYRGGGAFRKGM